MCKGLKGYERGQVSQGLFQLETGLNLTSQESSGAQCHPAGLVSPVAGQHSFEAWVHQLLTGLPGRSEVSRFSFADNFLGQGEE